MNIEHLAFNVPDPVAMADWYVRHLGMRIVRSLPDSPYTRFLADQSGRVVLEIYHQTKAAVPDYFRIEPMTLHVAFTAANVQKERDRLLTAGATSAGDSATTPDGDELAMVRDPWGIVIQLVKRARPLVQPSKPGA